jgi:glyoxylase-like metal-dependent hydrolase (beta-lactamase superfamily II)
MLVDSALALDERALRAALYARRLEPGDIDAVINTHLHVDHCGNNVIFPRALIFLSQQEWRWTDAFYDALFASRTPEHVVAEFYPELQAHALKARTIRNATRLARLMWNRDRLGPADRFRWLEQSTLPSGLEVVATPGHTPFHLSIRVDAVEPVIIAGDAVLAEDPEAKVRTMIPYSQAQFLRSRAALLNRGERIVPGHGPSFLPLPSREPAAEVG